MHSFRPAFSATVVLVSFLLLMAAMFQVLPVFTLAAGFLPVFAYRKFPGKKIPTLPD